MDLLGINSYVSYMIIALVWTLWHIPYLQELTWVFSPEALVTFIPRYLIVLFAFSIFYGEIRAITGSFGPAVLTHGVNSALGHPLTAEYITVAAGKDYLGSISTGIFIIIFFALVGAVINRW